MIIDWVSILIGVLILINVMGSAMLAYVLFEDDDRKITACLTFGFALSSGLVICAIHQSGGSNLLQLSATSISIMVTLVIFAVTKWRDYTEEKASRMPARPNLRVIHTNKNR